MGVFLTSFRPGSHLWAEPSVMAEREREKSLELAKIKLKAVGCGAQ